MSSIFGRIISGEIPSYKVYEDDSVYGFLDIFPKQKGHVLLIPKNEVANFEDLTSEMRNDLFAVASRVALALKKKYRCKKIGLMVEGLEVEHCHLHLIPINKPGDMHVQSKEFTKQEFIDIATEIKTNID